VNPQQALPAAPSATPAPLHDIAGPVSFFPYPIWMVVAAALVLLALIGLVVWLVARRKPRKPLTPAEKAFAELARLRGEVAASEPYDFSIAVSDVLRVYLRDARGLSATTQTSREFLETVRTRHVFNDAEREALAAFLDKADLIKFARLHATTEDSSALLEQAERLVRAAQAPEPTEAAAQ
jgi:hypothetical protein